LLFFGKILLIVAISCTLTGAMFGLGLSYYMMRCTVIAPPSQIPMAISVTTMSAGIGSFLSTYISLLLQRLLETSITGIIPALAIILAAGAVLSFAMALGSRGNKTAPLASGPEK
jgi:hypothetical protein